MQPRYVSNRVGTWGISNFEKKMASFPLQIRYCRTFNINSHIVLLRNWEKKRKNREIKKILDKEKKKYSPGLELMTPGSRGQRSNNIAMEDSRYEKSIFPIYRQSIF